MRVSRSMLPSFGGGFHLAAAWPLAVGGLAFALAAPVVVATPSANSVRVEVAAAVHHDRSGRLGNQPSAPSARKLTEHPLRSVPHVAPGQVVADPVAQTTVSGPAAAVTGVRDFAGVGYGDYGFAPDAAPPDTNGAAGDRQYVQWVNESIGVFDKSTGAMAAGFPKTGNTLWAGFGGPCQTSNDGDPIVTYDQDAGRWFFTQFAVSQQPYLECVAVSTTSDATGPYNRYSFSYGNQFPDYPKVGVWPDAYYITFNIFNNGSAWAGAKACAYDRANMLNGLPAAQQCAQLSTAYGGLLPSDIDGSTPPPPGAPNVLLNFGSNSLREWKFHVDWATPANSTFTGPTNIPVAAFSAACGGGGACIPQSQSRQKLDSLADRLMYRLAYRNFGGQESWVVNHSVTIGGGSGPGKKSASRVGVRWYELRGLNGTPTVSQQGTFGATTSDSLFRWMGSIAMDRNGDIALGYSTSSSNSHPGIRYATRLATDPPDTLTGENTIITGGGSQQPNLSRWGDYSAMSIDPVDDCTFWYTNEYLKSNGAFNWSTRIATFRIAGC